MFQVFLLVGFAILSVCSLSIDGDNNRLRHFGDNADSVDSIPNDMDVNSVGQVFHVATKKGQRTFGELPSAVTH